MKFITNDLSHSVLCFDYKENDMEDMVNTKFPGWHSDNHLSWKNHVEQVIPKLIGACYVIRISIRIGNMNTLK
jgi:hypothetical protein